MREQKLRKDRIFNVTVLRQLNYLEWRFLALKYRQVIILVLEFCHREPRYNVLAHPFVLTATALGFLLGSRLQEMDADLIAIYPG